MTRLATPFLLILAFCTSLFAAEEITPEPNPPQVVGRAFSVTATVEGQNPDGVVLAHGGVAFGYSLYFVDGKPAFAYRNSKELTTLVADEPVSGRVDLVATVDEKQITLAVDGKLVASAKSPGLLEEQPGLGLYVGADGVHPVGEYEVPNALEGRVVSHKVEVVIPKVTMRTPWGEQLDPGEVWRQYPRPALARDEWTILNGRWNYAVTPGGVSEAPSTWDGEILVPFAIEAPLSGVQRRFGPDEALWYRRSVDSRKEEGRRYLLNFEAVDYQSTVWVNGRKVGSHTGGNLPFSFDVTEAFKDGTNVFTVRVTDATDTAYQLHGKQRLQPKGIWYTPVSGIWQTVWMEALPEVYVAGLKTTAGIDGNVLVRVATAGPVDENLKATVIASLDGREVARGEGAPDAVRLKINHPRLWSPDSPTLYDLRIELGDDVVRSYVGLRKVGKTLDADGHLRFTLNGKPIFHWGTLDQGWWPDGLLTPPSDEAMRSDIEFLKAAGFNTIRKHIKVEPRRYYYHCDKLGMMMWQDQVSAMADNPEWTRLKPDPQTVTWPEAAHRQYMTELKGMIDLLGNHPCIVQWVPFNERWGQHQSVEVGRWTVDYDTTRHVNIASGGNWFPAGHIVDHHQYPHPGFPFELGDGGRFDGYIKVVGEFGGHGFPVEGHVWNPGARNWGYGGLPKDKDEWLERYRTSIQMLAELKKQGIAAGIYTQTTDVEGEINGLITYDRKVRKIPAEKLAEIHQAAGVTAERNAE